MNTPAHLIIGAAAFAKPGNRGVTSAAIGGSILPDISLYVMTFWALLVDGHSLGHIFDVLYFSDRWQQVFAIDNSVFVWGAVLALGVWVRKPWVWILAAAALLHLAFDFPLHHDDGRMHFWPLSTWVFESPISYWDFRYHGAVFATVEMAVVLILAVVLVRRFRSWLVGALVATVAVFEVAPYFLYSALLGL